MTKFLIVGDLHGQIPKIREKKFDAIIAPGDFCSDELKKYIFLEIKNKYKTGKSKRWYDLAGRKNAEKMIKKSLDDGRNVLKFLNSFNIPVYVVPGNWDWTTESGFELKILRKNNYGTITKGLKNIIDVHHKIVITDEFSIIGHGIYPYPEFPKNKQDLKMFSKEELRYRKKDYEELLKKVDDLFKRAKKQNLKKSIIFLSHNVPYNTKIDLVLDKKSPRYAEHYGSLVAKVLIKKHQPLVSIGGHMHECFGKCKIGKTVCINTGFGSKVNTVLEIENGKITKLKFLGEKTIE